MLEAFLHVLNTPQMWTALGMVTALSMFISPILYNGDYKGATKTVAIVLGYAFVVSLLNVFHLVEEGNSINVWLQPVSISFLVGLAYALGLYIGVFINKHTERKLKSRKLSEK